MIINIKDLKLSEANAGHGMSEYVIRLGHDKTEAERVLAILKANDKQNYTPLIY